MNLASLPKSKAKTAYGLLSDVARITLDEPKRMRMGLWMNRESVNRVFAEEEYPLCGTVGCIGGWVDVLKGTRYGANVVLGLSEVQENELFYGPLCNERDQGTVRHARRVVALIRRFQEKYAKQLKAKKL